MRTKSWQDIVNAPMTQSAFKPLPDNKIVFSDYAAQYSAGKLSSVPAIIGTAQHEFNAIVPALPGVPFNQTASDVVTNTTFLCTAASTSQMRHTAGRKTFRYLYDGDWPNISPPSFPGAWHASELPLIFGTAPGFHGPDTVQETATSAAMQDLWLDFVSDPEVFERTSKWPEYGTGNGVVLGAAQGNPVQNVRVADLDAPCASLDGISVSNLLSGLNVGALPI